MRALRLQPAWIGQKSERCLRWRNRPVPLPAERGGQRVRRVCAEPLEDRLGRGLLSLRL